MLALDEEVGALTEVVGIGVGDVDGVGLGVLVGDLVGVAVVLLGAGLGLSWVQATGPTIHAATNRAVMTGRRTGLLGWGRLGWMGGQSWAQAGS